MEDRLTTKPDVEKRSEILMELRVCGAEDAIERNALEDIKEANNLFHKDLDELNKTETEHTTGNGQKYKKKTVIPPVNTECKGKEKPTEKRIAKVNLMWFTKIVRKNAHN